MAKLKKPKAPKMSANDAAWKNYETKLKRYNDQQAKLQKRRDLRDGIRKSLGGK